MMHFNLTKIECITIKFVDRVRNNVLGFWNYMRNRDLGKISGKQKTPPSDEVFC
jgi:hypothetical protein